MNEPLGGWEELCVSQFTLYADRAGNRPSFVAAARPSSREPLYYRFCDLPGAAEALGAHMAGGPRQRNPFREMRVLWKPDNCSVSGRPHLALRDCLP